MSEIAEKGLLYISELKKELAAKSNAARNDSRDDEGKLYAVRASVCDAISAVYNVSAKKVDREILATEFENAVKRISANWFKRFDTAKAHSDFETVAVEEAKIETAQTVTSQIRKMIEEGQNDRK